MSFLELLSYDFSKNALLAGTLLGIVASLLGVFVVLKGMSFIGAGISHAAFGGAALGYLLGFDPILSALIFSLFGALILPSLKGNLIGEDSGVGIFFSLGMALGLLVLGLLKGARVDLFGYLFGNILAVGDEDLLWFLILAISAVSFVLLLYRHLVISVFDPDFSLVLGIRVSLLEKVLLILISASVVVGMKVVGAVLVSAMLVIPPATARYLAWNFTSMLLISVAVGLISSWGGLFLSFRFDLPPGPLMVIISALLFLISRLLSYLKG